MKRWLGVFLGATGCLFLAIAASGAEPISLGLRREPLVDDALIESMEGALRLKLHHPHPEEVAIQFNQPWEGNASGYATVFQDGDRYRLYYRGHRYLIDEPPLRQAQSEAVCYAESQDGIHWEKPNLGLFKWPGANENNIIWMGTPEAHNFAPFKDSNPNCPAAQRYKAIGGTVTSKGLWTFASADGIHWKRLSKGPVVTKGAFDSHNTVFWDAGQNRYSMYVRYFGNGLRLIGWSHSHDFKTWTEPVGLDYPASPAQQMYTNQILPYYRAPHILFGFPTRYVAKPLTEHNRQLPPAELREKLINAAQRVGTDLTDGLFMSSRNGRSFRRWDEAFLRPGPEAKGRWIYGDNYQAWGLFESRTKVPENSPEISMLFEEGAWRDEIRRLRRYTIRLDGFVSLNASFAGGEMTTKPVTFSGSRLLVNYSTSAAGSLRVAILDSDGTAMPGFGLHDADELYGDTTSQSVSWTSNSDVSGLAGKPVRLRFQLTDGDLYSFQFAETDQ
jgi:hypothetical protein